MPVWKASRERIRERGKKRERREGEEERGSEGIAWYETEEDLYVESGCITLCVFVDMKSAAHFVLSLS